MRLIVYQCNEQNNCILKCIGFRDQGAALEEIEDYTGLANIITILAGYDIWTVK